MSLNDLRACRNALKKMQTHKRAGLFLQPVGPVRDHAPKYVVDIYPVCLCVLTPFFYRYFEVIKSPMDLSTMGAKLETGMYEDRFAFEADFALMINNAKQYNVVGSFAHNEAIVLQTSFDKRK
jgi:transcription initiation factor TFIID subunit 2